jgi:type I restriction enzyme R subunit
MKAKQLRRIVQEAIASVLNEDAAADQAAQAAKKTAIDKEIIEKLNSGMSPAEISIEYGKEGKNITVSYVRHIKMLLKADMLHLLEEEFDKFDDRYLPNPNDYDTIKGFFQSYLNDGELRDIVDSKQYGLLNTHPSGQFFKNIPEQYRKIIPDYINNNVPLNKFVS